MIEFQPLCWALLSVGRKFAMAAILPNPQDHRSLVHAHGALESRAGDETSSAIRMPWPGAAGAQRRSAICPLNGFLAYAGRWCILGFG